MAQSERAFFGPVGDLSPDEEIKKEKSWKQIVQDNYWDVWYDDNFGEYLIQLKVKE